MAAASIVLLGSRSQVVGRNPRIGKNLVFHGPEWHRTNRGELFQLMLTLIDLRKRAQEDVRDETGQLRLP
jgi:hypothetical protein